MAETATSVNNEKECQDQNQGYHDSVEVPSEQPSKNLEFSSIVAQHYNRLEDIGIHARQGSNILYLRNFNNWIKSVLLNIYYEKLGDMRNVLDLCCGKGGDLRKWKTTRLQHLICVDIADVSLQQCESRYNTLKEKSPNIFTCEFITADCTRVRLKEKFKNPDIKLDLVSCQFSFHYCFESLPQAECMLRNASECLKVGGYFIGTIPNAFEIVKRIEKAGTKTLKNNVFSIEMISDKPYPLFGAQYFFNLDSVVQCPEFLVYFPVFKKLAAKFNLELDYREDFEKFYKKNVSKFQNVVLLKRMFALEPYCILEDYNVKSDLEYGHAAKYCKDNNYTEKIGTLSKSEWEAISLYQVFAFKKVA